MKEAGNNPVKINGQVKELKVQKQTSSNAWKSLKTLYLKPHDNTKAVRSGKESARLETNPLQYDKIVLEQTEGMEWDTNTMNSDESIKSPKPCYKDLSEKEISTQTLPEDHEKLSRTEVETQTLPNDHEKVEAGTQTLEEEPTRDQLLLQYNKLKSDYEQIKKENSLLKLAQSEAPKIPTTNKSAANSLTKPQLYMGIKKYLGPTMAALLRIELFGGSEDRSWKEDEQQFAVELLQLGEEVYKYCCDEWRFRLPPLRLARTWLEADNQAAKDDETLDL